VKPIPELVEAARAVAHSVAEGAYGTEVRIEVDNTADDWHGSLLRHVFEQQMSLLTPVAFLDVIGDGADHVVGYVDHEAYRRADEASVLDDAQVAAIVSDNEFLPPRSRIVQRTSYAGPEGGRLEGVVVEGAAGSSRRRWLVEINIARRLVASVRPLDETEAGTEQ
jgi:hypothetical protein